ncbi:uncharacterized, partial [Tachysurus ichikawai]
RLLTLQQRVTAPYQVIATSSTSADTFRVRHLLVVY